jgi:hypothetical protein
VAPAECEGYRLATPSAAFFLGHGIAARVQCEFRKPGRGRGR